MRWTLECFMWFGLKKLANTSIQSHSVGTPRSIPTLNASTASLTSKQITHRKFTTITIVSILILRFCLQSHLTQKTSKWESCSGSTWRTTSRGTLSPLSSSHSTVIESSTLWKLSELSSTQQEKFALMSSFSKTPKNMSHMYWYCYLRRRFLRSSTNTSLWTCSHSSPSIWKSFPQFQLTSSTRCSTNGVARRTQLSLEEPSSLTNSSTTLSTK